MAEHFGKLTQAFARRMKALRESELGATAVEYGIMVALIAVVIIAAVWGIGQALKDDFECVSDYLEYTDQDGSPAC
ncbi:MAG TPA: Flp family type IVb pilin [Nitriliruptorales bacterium]